MDSTKQRVREFYDEVGWAQEADGPLPECAL